jgi:hypothetical protein
VEVLRISFLSGVSIRKDSILLTKAFPQPEMGGQKEGGYGYTLGMSRERAV